MARVLTLKEWAAENDSPLASEWFSNLNLGTTPEIEPVDST